MDREFLPTDEANHGPLAVNVVVRGSQWGKTRELWETQVLPLLMQYSMETRVDGKARGVILSTPGKMHLQIVVSRFHVHDVPGSEVFESILTPVTLGDA